MENTEKNVYESYPRVKAVGKKLCWAFLIMYVIGNLFSLSFYYNITRSVENFIEELNIKGSFMEMSLSMEPAPGEVVKLSWPEFMTAQATGRGEEYLEQAFEGQGDRIKASAEKLLSDITFGLVRPDMPSERNVQMAMLIVLFSVTATLLIIPLTILFYVLLYKAWKGLRPLGALEPDMRTKLVSPVLAIVLLFIPMVNLIWMIFALAKYPKLGKSMASHIGASYRGPGGGLMWVYIVAFWIGFVLNNGIQFGLYFPSMLTVMFCINALTILLLIPITLKLRDAVEDLALYKGVN